MAEQPTALITGASSGIGLATAKRLLAEGYSVIGISRRGAVAGFEAPDFRPVSLDLADSGALDNALDEFSEPGCIDCFIHAAGRGLFGSIEQMSTTQIETGLRVNLTSAMLICRRLVPAMRRRGSGRRLFCPCACR